MPNDFADTTNTGILKDYYQESPMSAALKKKREKLAKSKGVGENKEGEKENG